MKFFVLFLLPLCLQALVKSELLDSPSLSSILKYRGYKVFRASPVTVNQLNSVLGLGNVFKNLDFWTEPRVLGASVDIMVPPASFTQVVDYFHFLHIPFDIIIEDLQSLISGQLEDVGASQRRVLPSPKDGLLLWTRYYRLKDIHAYMQSLANRYPNFVKLMTIGHSTEGRELKIVKIGCVSHKVKKPAIWIDAGIHAREWVSPATALYFIDQLVKGVARNDSKVIKYAEEIDWYILPVVNPDGYEYTHTTTRMWRKTRARHGIFCRGADPNRNFGFHWNEEGASSDPCSDVYAGPRAFSEPETLALAQFVLNHNDTIKIFVSMHSYGQFWLTPWGYTRRLPSDYKHLYSLAVKASNALRSVYGTKYTIGTSTNVLYAASGGSDDWAKGVAGIKYSYTLELRDMGGYGFLLPPRMIEPTGKETWAAMQVLADNVIDGLP